jgi:TPR repeat protein
MNITELFVPIRPGKKSSLHVPTNFPRLSKAMSLIFGPKPHFYGANCGRSEFEGGIIPFSDLHRLFCLHQPDLVSGKEEETKMVCAFFQMLGVCRILKQDEDAHCDNEDIYEFPELLRESEYPFLPSDPKTDACHKVLCVCFDNVTRCSFLQFRQQLVSSKQLVYKPYLNSVIISRHDNLELWFHKDNKLHVLTRGPNLEASINDIHDTAVRPTQVRRQLIFDPDLDDHAYCQKRAKEGLAEAQYMMGLYYASTGSIPSLALEFYQAAANQGHEEAQFKLAEHYFRCGSRSDLKKAVLYFQLSADQEHQEAKRKLVDAQFYLGHRYLNPLETETKDERQAIQYLRIAADRGHQEARKVLTEGSFGDLKDEQMSIYYGRLLLAQENPPSAHTLLTIANLYANWLGNAPDDSASVYYYEKAAATGDSEARFNIACCRSHRVEDAINPKLALIDFKRLKKKYPEDQWNREAEKALLTLKDDKPSSTFPSEDKEALFQLGLDYEKGRKTIKDEKMAIKCYKQASDLHHPEAKYRLTQFMHDRPAMQLKTFKEIVEMKNVEASLVTKAQKKLDALEAQQPPIKTRGRSRAGASSSDSVDDVSLHPPAIHKKPNPVNQHTPSPIPKRKEPMEDPVSSTARGMPPPLPERKRKQTSPLDFSGQSRSSSPPSTPTPNSASPPPLRSVTPPPIQSKRKPASPRTINAPPISATPGSPTPQKRNPSSPREGLTRSPTSPSSTSPPPVSPSSTSPQLKKKSHRLSNPPPTGSIKKTGHISVPTSPTVEKSSKPASPGRASSASAVEGKDKKRREKSTRERVQVWISFTQFVR